MKRRACRVTASDRSSAVCQLCGGGRQTHSALTMDTLSNCGWRGEDNLAERDANALLAYIKAIRCILVVNHALLLFQQANPFLRKEEDSILAQYLARGTEPSMENLI